MRIKNPNLANTTLNTREGEIVGDALGVFDVSEELAEQLIATPGWAKVSTRAPAGAAPTAPSDPSTNMKPKGPGAKGPGKAKEEPKAPETTEPPIDAKESLEGAPKDAEPTEKKEG